jgi:hypothetical protein
MKQLFKLLAVFASALSSTAVFGQLIQVDEFGKGTFFLPGATNSLPPAVIAVEPFSGIATLRYTLPFNGTPGDVAMFETGPGPVTNGISDLIRFDGQGHLYFFSDREANDPTPPDPADVGIPPILTQFPHVSIQEFGVEGQNGASYFPIAGGPGFEPAFPGLQYSFISDVPEPSALALSTTGGIFLLLLRARRITKRG